jgi:predicted ATPase
VLDILLDALGPQEVLIVLDNCEHLITTCATVADAILRRCPKVHLMTTSREPLGISGETIYRVPSLSLPAPDQDDALALAGSDAVVLFVERARSHGVDVVLDKEAGPLVASTCRRLDGMPLAIELAAARLRSLSLSSLHDLLDKRLRLLTGGSRTAMERQQTLRATVDWSYSLLSDAERSVLRRLSVFADGFDLEAAGAVCTFGDIEEFDVTDILGSLVDKSLALAEPSAEALRYRLLETIRQFAAERLVELNENEAARVAAAHCEHFLNLAETAAPHLTGPDPARWFARLDADQANLRRAIEHAADDPGKTSVVLRFADALGYYWFTRARRHEAFGLLMPVLERPEARREPRLLVKALVVGASTATSVDREIMQRLTEQAVELAGQLDDEALLVESQMALASARLFANDRQGAYPLAEECLERARRLDDDRLLAECLLLNITCSQEIDPARADALHLEALACAERSGNLLLTHDLHVYAGVGALEAGNAAAARQHLEQASQAGRVFGAASHYVNVNLGMCLREEGDREDAIAMLEDALRASRRSGDGSGLAYSSLGLACLAGDLADWRRAAELHGVAQAFLDQIGQPWLHYGRSRQASIDTIRSSLGDDEFQRSYSRGRELSFDNAVDLALRRTRLTPAFAE